MKTMKTEYLISVDSTKSCNCKDETGFALLLKLGGDIDINGNILTYKNKNYIYENKKYENDKSDFIYFHIIITARIPYIQSNTKNGKNSLDRNDLELYESLLSCIKDSIEMVASTIQPIWDDVSLYYSELTYPIIYDLENMMRKLLTKFMVINVGKNWQKVNTPEKLERFTKNKNNDKGNNINNEALLYKFNFSQLSNYLFDEFVMYDINDLVHKKCNRNTDEIVISKKELDPYLRKNNWDRFFDEFVELDGDKLKNLWSELYTYRCKVAHNNQFTRENYERVQEIYKEIKPQIQKAIDNLDLVVVDSAEREILSESFATMDVYVKKFISKYNIMCDLIKDFDEKRGLELYPRSLESSGKGIELELHKKIRTLFMKGIIDDKDKGEIESIISFRNILVYDIAHVDRDVVCEYIRKVDRITSKIISEKGDYYSGPLMSRDKLYGGLRDDCDINLDLWDFDDDDYF